MSKPYYLYGIINHLKLSIMKPITSFDKQNLPKLRVEIDAALAKVFEAAASKGQSGTLASRTTK